MDWEDKVKMVQLGNKLPETKLEFQELVLDKLTEFDAQGVDMFLNLIELIPEDIAKDEEFYRKIYDQFMALEIGKELNFRSTMRLCMFETIIEDDLKNE